MTTEFDPENLNLQSPEGCMLNAAMAILTTKCMSDVAYMEVYKMVKELAIKIKEDHKRNDQTP